jgi:hypothetical protein
MRRYEYGGVIYLRYTLPEIWKNWRMSDALDEFRDPPVLVPVLQDYITENQIPFYKDHVTKLPTFEFKDPVLEKAFLKLFNPKGGG